MAAPPSPSALWNSICILLLPPQGKRNFPEWASPKVTVGRTRWCSTSSVTPWGSTQPLKASDWWGVQVTAGEQLCSGLKKKKIWSNDVLFSEDHGTLLQRYDGRLRAVSVHGQSGKINKSQESDRDRWERRAGYCEIYMNCSIHSFILTLITWKKSLF